MNLDSGGHAHEAGIATLHGEPFDDKSAAPLVHPDPERYDLTIELNRELMDCVDRVLVEELTRTWADLEDLRRTLVSDTLAGEIRFTAEFAKMLREMAEGRGRFGEIRRTCSMDILRTMERKRLEVHDQASGVTGI